MEGYHGYDTGKNEKTQEADGRFVGFICVGRCICRKIGLDQEGKRRESDQTQKATKGTIKKTVEGSGSVASAATQTVSFSSDVSVQSIKKKDGSSVKKGDTIAVLTSSSLEDSISSLENQISSLENTLSQGAESASSTISSKVSGRVKRIYAKDGTAVAKTMDSKGALMEISADGKVLSRLRSEERRVGKEC